MFFFVVSDVAPNVYNRSWRLLSCGYSNLKHLRKYKLEHLQALALFTCKSDKKWTPATSIQRLLKMKKYFA